MKGRAKRKGDEFGFNEAGLKEYLKFKENWCTLIDGNTMVFTPLNFPLLEHWLGVLMWRKGKTHYIRVYNSYTKLKSFETYIACMFAMLYHEMGKVLGKNSKHIQKWVISPPQDVVLAQMASSNRCGLYVMLRAYQIALGEHTTTKVKHAQHIPCFIRHMQKSFLDVNPILCNDDVIPLVTLLEPAVDDGKT
jgi:hypothetical protein